MCKFGSGRFLTSSSADAPWLESSFLPGRGLLAAGGGGRLCKVVERNDSLDRNRRDLRDRVGSRGSVHSAGQNALEQKEG